MSPRHLAFQGTERNLKRLGGFSIIQLLDIHQHEGGPKLWVQLFQGRFNGLPQNSWRWTASSGVSPGSTSQGSGAIPGEFVQGNRGTALLQAQQVEAGIGDNPHQPGFEAASPESCISG